MKANLGVQCDDLIGELPITPMKASIIAIQCDELVDPSLKPSCCTTCKGKKKVDAQLWSDKDYQKVHENELAMGKIKKAQAISEWSQVPVQDSQNVYNLYENMISSKAINYNQEGLFFPSPKLVEAPKKRKASPSKPKVKYCTEC